MVQMLCTVLNFGTSSVTARLTLNADPEIAAWVNAEIRNREEYYRAKWGGPPGSEAFDKPFNGRFQ